ncbi:MAG TPA: hypothetical protein VFQ45_20585, partial [Longimicrobium sp.]|nr:hypothetical protein [Longimicrobium sp.]
MAATEHAHPADQLPPFICPVCGKTVEREKPDNAGWCSQCRERLVRRSGRLAWIPALVVGALYAWLLVWSGLAGTTLLVAWVALGVVLAWVAYKVGHRVFFDVLRGRTSTGGHG